MEAIPVSHQQQFETAEKTNDTIADMKELILAKLHDTPEIFHSLQGKGFPPHPERLRAHQRLQPAMPLVRYEYTWNWYGTPYSHAKDLPDQAAKHDRQQVQVRLQRGIDEQIAAIDCRNIIFHRRRTSASAKRTGRCGPATGDPS